MQELMLGQYFFDGIAPEVMEKYKSDLINSGWKIKPDKLNFGQPSEHFLAEKNNLSLTFIIRIQENKVSFLNDVIIHIVEKNAKSEK